MVALAIPTYVEAHAGTGGVNCCTPRANVCDNIVVRYDPMPDWMEFSNLITLDTDDKHFTAQNEIHFRHLLHVYRSDRKDYISSVKSRLSQIKERLTGSALLAEVDATDSDVEIMPNWKQEINSHTTPSDDARATARGRPLDYDDRKIKTVGNVGEGGGSDSTINFTPGMYTGSVMAQEAKAPDEVLFHELVHASRQMRGVRNEIPVNAGYGTQEEYLAVVLTNIYMSEKGQWRFRASHGAWGEDETPQGANAILQGGDADWFLRNVQKVNLPPRQLMENFKSGQPDFYNKLAYLPPDRPKFNPVRQYFEEQKGKFAM